MPGVTLTGFEAKTQEEIETSLATSIRGDVDPALDFSPETPQGQINAIFANALAEVWEVAAVIRSGMDLDQAEGFQLDVIGAFRGRPRLPQRFGRVGVTLNLAAAATVPQGTVFHVSGDASNTWALEAPVTAVLAGNYAGVAVATAAGPIPAPAGTLTVVPTPIPGLNSVTNALDATVGALVESDTAYRARLKIVGLPSGRDALEAIQDAVEAVPGVISARVAENITMVPDQGIAAKAIHVAVWDGSPNAASNDEIATAIGRSKAGGIQASPNTFAPLTNYTGNYVNSLGVTRVIEFSRVTVVDLYVDVTVQVIASRFPGDGIAQVKNKLAELVGLTGQGGTVYSLQLQAALLEAGGGISGVINVPSFAMGTSDPPPVLSSLVANYYQIFRLLVANIDVVVTT